MEGFSQMPQIERRKMLQSIMPEVATQQVVDAILSEKPNKKSLPSTDCLRAMTN